MLVSFRNDPLPEADQKVFNALVPFDHVLRRAERCIDFPMLRERIIGFYSVDQGRPCLEPLRMLKFSFLQYQYNLSDRQVLERSQTDVAFRYFLGLGLNDALPDSSSLCTFRARLGHEGFQGVFNEIVGQARQHKLVKDRLRIKDATHVIADVAIPSTLQLVAQTRDLLLAAAEAFDPERVAGERGRIEMIRQTAGPSAAPGARLAVRVVHLREILDWAETLTAPDHADSNANWEKLGHARELARKVLGDHDEPKAGDRLRSVVDPDARCGKHGAYYEGYLLDILIDADSELYTAIDVLPANGYEALNAVELLRQEQQAHGNKIEQFSIDGIGMNGPVLRQLQDPEGLALEVFVPPGPKPSTERFTPQDFTENPEAATVTCPAGETSTQRSREEDRHRTTYKFAAATCAGCVLKSQCLNKADQKSGRKVIINDYDAEYSAARAKAATPEYAAVRKEHPKVERKLSELVRRHGSRRARYRGRPRVLIQQLLAAMAANIKRMVTLLGGPICAPACA